MVAAGLGLTPLAQAQPAGVPLVDETFTGATADPEFLAYGPACLTGAPEDPTLPPTSAHELTGCLPEGAGPVPPANAAPHGYLRLTSADEDQSAAVLHNHALPASQGLVVTFDQWQYGNTTVPPADGISFFLIDGAAQLTAPGAFGGSLGYAQKLPDDDPAEEFASPATVTASPARAGRATRAATGSSRPRRADVTGRPPDRPADPTSPTTLPRRRPPAGQGMSGHVTRWKRAQGSKAGGAGLLPTTVSWEGREVNLG
jgi:hypothetical protein